MADPLSDRGPQGFVLGLAEYLDEMVRFQGFVRGRSLSALRENVGWVG